MAKNLEVAYFSMEIMLRSEIPSYAGGLGVLAGDLLRSIADMKIAGAGVSLLYNGNSFRQIINPDGSQSFKSTPWHKNEHFVRLQTTIDLVINNTPVKVAIWRFDVVGYSGFVVPVYLLDTNVLENNEWARNITRNLYEGEFRLAQEILLGVGGVKMLRALGYKNIKTFHMNEGHAAFVPLALLPENEWNDEKVREQCVFTTHTPIPEGHDHFSYDYAYQMAGDLLPWHIKKVATEDSLSMTHLALNMSKYSFGVSQKHEAVSKNILPGYDIHSITNGVHHRSWVSPFIQEVFNDNIPNWIKDPTALNKAPQLIPDEFLWNAHQESKKDLIQYVNQNLISVSSVSEQQNPPKNELFDVDTLTIALARRPVPYKRPLLLYSDLDRLLRIGDGKIQIIQCGKAYLGDPSSQGFVHEVIEISKKLRGRIKVVYLENYSPLIARFLVAGCDVWLNTPRRPLEASGTSGMKAALNGVLNFSVLDGWWIEGNTRNPYAGFCIGPQDDSVTPSNDDSADAESLYSQLENVIIPLYYSNREEWIQRMKNAITLGAYFNTHRCIEEYREKAWDF